MDGLATHPPPSSGPAEAPARVFPHYFGDELAGIELIWQALSGYAKHDIDAVIGAVCLGLRGLESGMGRL